MKKLAVTLTVLMGLGLSQVNAQTVFNYGVKVDANVSNYILKDMPGYTSEMRAGADLGGFMKMEFGHWFALQPELMFNFRSSFLKTNRAIQKLEYWGMEIPVYAVGQMDLGTGKGYVGLGPYVGMGFSNKNKATDVDLYDKDVLKAFDLGGKMMLGYEFPMGLQINASYQMGFLDLVDKGFVSGSKMRTQVVSLGVGYRF